jgi:putative membrane protein
MEVAGVELLLRPEATALALGFVAAGIALGTASGLTPGLHANTFALLLAAVAPAIPGPPRFVGAAMLAAGVIHTFLDVVPALSLGVPDPAMAPSALPGHRLVLRGRGREALRLSALGSGLAVVFAIPLALPVTWVMERAYPALSANLSLLLGAVIVLLVTTEPTSRSRVGAAVAMAASGTLGIVALDWPTQGLLDVSGMLMPLFTGLFGAPILVEALGGEGLPAQADPVVTTSPLLVGYVALLGTFSGAIVGYLPGISSAIAATGALVAIPRRGPRAFIVATSGVNTANAIFALFALLALGDPRTGVLVALDEAGVPIALPLLLATIGLAAAVGFVLVVTLGDRYLALVGAIDHTRLCLAVLGLLVLLVGVFAGVSGLGVFVASAAVGLIPARLGARRASLMGVLLVPLALA